MLTESLGTLFPARANFLWQNLSNFLISTKNRKKARKLCSITGAFKWVDILYIIYHYKLTKSIINNYKLLLLQQFISHLLVHDSNPIIYLGRSLEWGRTMGVPWIWRWSSWCTSYRGRWTEIHSSCCELSLYDRNLRKWTISFTDIHI